MIDQISPLTGNWATNTQTIEFYYSYSEKLKKLSGYQNGKHFIPKYHSKSLDEFVGNISRDDIDSAMIEICDHLRHILELGVNDYYFDVSSSDGGLFESNGIGLYINCKPDPENLTDVIFTNRLELSTEKMQYLEKIIAVLPFHYTFARLTLASGIVLKDFISQVETYCKNNSPDIVYYYDPAAQFLEISSQVTGKCMIITSSHIDIYFTETYTILNFLERWPNQ